MTDQTTPQLHRLRATFPWREAGLAASALGAALLFLLDPTRLQAAPELRSLTALALVLWALRRLYVLGRAWDDLEAWGTARAWSLSSEVLPLEETTGRGPRVLRLRWLRAGRLPDPGLFVGRAFRWTARHTQALETVLFRDGSLPVGEDVRGGHPALHAVGRRQERPLVLPWSELVGHVLVAGTTRSGKTRCLELLAAEAIRAPGAVVVIDPKGDRELLARCAFEAERQGRPFALFDPAFPSLSATFNPLETASTPAEVAARIQALMPGGGAKRGDPFFEEFPLAVIERVAAAQAALGERWTLEGLAHVTAHAPRMLELLERYLRHLLGPRADGESLEELIQQYRRTRFQDPVAEDLIEYKEKPREHWQKVTANLIPAFRGVTGAPLGRLLSTIPADLTWDRIVDREMVVCFSLSALLLEEVANRIGRVILQDLTGYLGRRYAYDTDVRTATPLTILVDEFANVAYPLFINALNKAGGANARFVLAMQSLADPEAAMGPDRARQVFDNLNTKLWFRLADARTAEEATRGLGLCTVLLPEEGAGLSYGGIGGLVGKVDRSLKQKAVPLLRPEWLMALPRGEAVVRMKGEVWKLRVPLLDPPPPGVLVRLGVSEK